MKHRLISKTVIFLFAISVLQIPLFAADVAKGNICGRVYQSDMKTPVKKGEVRVVNATTGEAKNAAVDDDGCYCAKDLTIGNYSLSYSDPAKTEFLLPDKLLTQNKATLATCVAKGDNSTLSLMQECKVCKKGFPILGWILIPAAGGGAAAIIQRGGGTEPVASVSQP